MLFFPAVEIFRQPGKALAQVVCGENRGAVVPGCLGIGQPLYRRGEEHVVKRQYGIHVAGNLRQQQACREVDQERQVTKICPFQIFGHQGGEDDPGNITERGSQPDQKIRKGSAKSVYGQKNKIGCLGGAEGVAARHQGINPEKAAHYSHGVVGGSLCHIFGIHEDFLLTALSWKRK